MQQRNEEMKKKEDEETNEQGNDKQVIERTMKIIFQPFQKPVLCNVNLSNLYIQKTLIFSKGQLPII